VFEMKTIVVAIAARDFIRNHVMRNVFVIEYESGSKLCQSLCDRKVANGKFALCMGWGRSYCSPLVTPWLCFIWTTMLNVTGFWTHSEHYMAN